MAGAHTSEEGQQRVPSTVHTLENLGQQVPLNFIMGLLHQ
jgi:hypothetical protein